MIAKYSTFNLQITPNAVPMWDGVIDYTQVSQGTRRLSVEVPLTKVGDNRYEYVEIPLWVEESTVKNETSISMKGVPYSVLHISKPALPSVIAPSMSVVNDAGNEVEETRFIRGNSFRDAVLGLFNSTGWRVKIDADYLLDKPVVTEASPALVLNGSILEQLAELLGKFTPSNLWGQSLSYYVNIFSGEIVITAPNTNSPPSKVSIDAIHPFDLSVRRVFITPYKKLFIEESETALFRSIEHSKEYAIKNEPYNYETSSTIDESDGDATEIMASLSGDSLSLGGLMLSQYEDVTISQRTVRDIEWHWGGTNGSNDTETLHFIHGKSTNVTTKTEYTYICGPPYDSFESGYLSSLPTNSLFPDSIPGTRQQVSRDLGSSRISADNHPDFLLTTDGIQLLKKETISKETSASSGYYRIGDDLYSTPAPEVEGDTVTTRTVNTYSYNTDGILTGERSRKEVYKGTQIEVTDSFKTITKISPQLASEVEYSVSSKYNGTVSNETLIETSVTDVTAQVVSGEVSGPKPTSVLSSSEGTTALRNKLIHENIGVDSFGTIYTTVEFLNLEELEHFIKGNFILEADASYYASFSSHHIDVREALGGLISFVFSEEPNVPTVVNPVNMSKEEQNFSMLKEAMAVRPFCVSGISMSWDSDNPPNIAIALCQLV
jgi:hypothetical protein